MPKTIHLDKVLFPHDHLTKEDLLNYYMKIGKKMLPFLKNRPITIHRFPKGISGEGFMQKNISGSLLKTIPTAKVKTLLGEIRMPLVASLKALKQLVSLDAIVFHTPLSKLPHLNEADKIIFDLDPSTKDFGKVKEVAFLLKELLEEKLQLHTNILLTGSKGLHVIIFLKTSIPFEETKAFAKAAAQYMVKQHPTLCTTALRKSAREKKVFIDYLRNVKGQTSVCPYSVRPLEQGPIAAPITWKDLKKKSIHPQFYTLKNPRTIYTQKRSPWDIIFTTRLKFIQATKDLKDITND